ncbi:MAG: 23S rRNA (pseudouridine(1915)-N(3))-methyltransferase RlmH [Candidatus Saccharibacteria bacterium]|nr:23S rRNA (pseudouridine(1915)-N(3))-methyltransferase RlmH [Candidatus Saccharibacteria bacterium]
MINIIAIGKKHEPWLADAVERYQKRLSTPFNLSWILLPNSSQKDAVAIKNESGDILNKLNPDDFIVLMDERGKMYDSPTLSKALVSPLEQSKNVVIIIGGAYGVSEEVRSRADIVWSLSPLVFPHQLIRLILVEQLYRAQSIHRGLPYHNE